MSLEALSSLATHCYLEIQKNVKVPTHEILQHFLKVFKYGGIDSKNKTVLEVSPIIGGSVPSAIYSNTVIASLID